MSKSRSTSAIDAIANYIGVLANCLDSTNYANDRIVYETRLAAAARIFHHLHNGNLAEAHEVIESEDRAYGYTWLSGPWAQLTGDAWDKVLQAFRSDA